MDTLGALQIFVRAAETRSFSETARQLRITPSAVSRSIARLERELDARLMHRSTRVVSLTEDGELFLERASRIVRDFDEAKEAAALHGKRGPRGTLRIDAPLGLGRLVLGPKLPRFLARYPELRVTLSLRDSMVDPVADRIDVALRIGEPKDSVLTVRRLAVGEMVICAAPAYLKRRGVPRTRADLDRHECLPFLRGESPRAWAFVRDGAEHPFVPRGRFATDNAELLRDAAVAGLGLVCLMDFMVAPDLATGALRRVLADDPLGGRALYALQPPHRQASPKARAFVDFLVEELAPPPRTTGRPSSR
ncbi:MAG TPA: LysR family transcriptional regulator [Polyangiaceae bacterium]|nr:LysR family transcriptional regulator [Polyangiaceae bacterium]